MDTILSTAPDKAPALAARYGAMAIPQAGPWNSAIAAMLGHRSVRAFRTDPLPAGTLETLVAAAQSAATSSNLQAWSVISVNDPAARVTLAQIAGNQKQIEQSPLYLVWLADLSRLERLGDAEHAELPGLPWTETFMVAVIDAALAAQNAVIAAESLGLSTVYIGAMRNDPERVAKLLDLPQHCFPVFGLCVGYADSRAAGAVKPRLPQGVVLHHERYSSAPEAAGRAAYDKVLGAYSQQQEMQSTTWTQRVLARMGNMKSLNGRERIRARLEALGFPLR